MSNDLLNLFALVDDERNPVRRITTSRSIQSELSSLFQEQRKIFYSDQTPVEFNGRYNVDEGEIFKIAKFKVDDRIIQALENPLSFDLLNLKQDRLKIKSLFCGQWHKKPREILFQVFDTRKIISHGKLTLLYSPESYTKLESPGIILGDGLAAVLQGQNLLFYSYQNTRRIFDLSSYYQEATDTDLNEFTQHENIQLKDKENFIKQADTVIRKKVALLQKNEVLNKMNMDEVKKKAKQFEIDLSIKKQNGKAKLMLPDDKKQIKEILRFLDEDYFFSVLTHKKCVTNSKKYLN